MSRSVMATVQKKAKAPVKKPVESTALNAALPDVKIHGEDLHFIPEHEQKKPTTFEIHSAENTFHQKEEVAFHQEKRKAQQAIASRKNAKRFPRRFS